MHAAVACTNLLNFHETEFNSRGQFPSGVSCDCPDAFPVKAPEMDILFPSLIYGTQLKWKNTVK